MKYIFYIFFSLYWGTYLLPFAYNLTGYQIEDILWSALMNNQPTLTGYTLAWSMRSFVNALVLVVGAMRLLSVRRWLAFHVDEVFLRQLLSGFTLVLLLYAFIMMRVQWNWGAMVWGVSAFMVMLSYPWQEPMAVPLEVDSDLYQHLVPLEEKK